MVNVDREISSAKRQEIEAYDNLGKLANKPYGYWWDRTMIRIIDGFRNLSIRLWIKEFLRNRLCLVNGCGDGGDLVFLQGVVNEVVGIDISFGQIYRAKEKCSNLPGAHLVVADAENLPFRRGSFESVFCKSILHHLPCLPRALAEIRRVLKDDGVFFVASEPGALNLIAAVGRKFFPSNAHTPGERPFIFSHLTKLIKRYGFIEIKTGYFHLITPALALKVLVAKRDRKKFAKIILKILMIESLLSRSWLKTFYWLFTGVFKKKRVEIEHVFF